MKKAERKGLGRGLSALLADVDTPDEGSSDAPKSADRQVPIEKVRPNPDQPRRHFSAEQLSDLENSIREKGIIQPLIVRKDPADSGFYQIVAGERRWRAAQKVKLHEVPVLIRDLNDTEVLELAIIENIQRADLNAVEEALGYKQLMERFGHTQEKLAAALGKSRSHIANLMRLLNLPQVVLDYIVEGKLSAGHARALVPAENAAELARKIIAEGLSVRQAEALVKAPKAKPAAKREASGKDADTRALEADLTANLRLKVSIAHKSSGKGEVKISYKNLDELEGLVQLLGQ